MIELEKLTAGGAFGRCCGFANVVQVRTVDSTNLLARRILDARKGDGACPKMAIVAWEQTAGRGRQGRSWVSTGGMGIYVTVVRPVLAAELQTLPLLVPVGLARAIRALGCRVGRKWPNDLLVAGKKLGGILIETVGGAAGEVVAIIGFGINHGQSSSELPLATATSLRHELGKPPNIATVSAFLLRELDRELEHLGDTEYARDAYEKLSVHSLGDHLSCRIGGRGIEGTFLGFDVHGFLRLDVGGTEQILPAAEVVE